MSASEILASRLQQWNLLEADVKVTQLRKRYKNFSPYFMEDGDLSYCTNIEALFEEFRFVHAPMEWRLFIDASKESIKAVLLHNGNKYPSVPVAYSANLLESYDTFRKILQPLDYDKFRWKICGDFKVIAILMGLQKGYTKYGCFLCMWDSRADDCHYVQRDWPPREEFTAGCSNVIHVPLTSQDKILMPPLHIKLGLMKQFAKVLDRQGAAFKYLLSKFPKLSEAKITAGVFNGPQIRELMHDELFDSVLDEPHLLAWEKFKDVTVGFLGNFKVPHYETLVNRMIDSYQAIGCRMSLKLHFLHSHLSFFPENCGAVSDEMGERFHQEIASLEKRFKGKKSINMLSDYCWQLKRESTHVHKRKSLKTAFDMCI